MSYEFLSPLGLTSRGGTTERVQAVLREAIVDSELAPGASLDKQAICDRLGVSRFPVSEALGRLQAEGLVEILPQRGTRVTRIRIADVRQSIFIRRALEAETVRMLARAPAPALVAALERNMRYQRTAVEAEDRRGFHALDLEFHQILLDALAYGRVRTIVESARASLERVRRLLTSSRRIAMTLAEHEAVVAALLARDARAAGQAMETHLDAVITELIAVASTKPGLFEDL
ncbi:GntR family transcriptional regulator [Labrys wisconsinensis]|uniref:DNA-binding GntR family transcriptional regulator n=1 Tax=Labrys wisconsinensis TaxID=425677 RepID=A0ABU0J405_9HYPH|nr:GntR family transcriptional regulator [Labrys wisconsinensis]MDQ0468999.1 DNA-binding GntR family transcriptional regulator [Labrys wisconsinensis]